MQIKIEFRDEWLTEYKEKIDLVPAMIYLENEGVQYPDDEWIDNPCILLGWWMHSVSELLLGAEGQDISFMEGPFFLKTTISGDMLSLVSEDEKVRWGINKLDFAKELLRASNSTSRYLQERGFKEKAAQLDQSAITLRDSMR